MSSNSQEIPIDSFGNPKTPAKSWYAIERSKQLTKGKACLKVVFGKNFVVFRGENGKAQVLDSRCHHMGAQLGKGKVMGNNIRCPFHFWEYGQDGVCNKIQYRDSIPPNAKVKSYATVEKHGLIWFFFTQDNEDPLYELPELNYYEGQKPFLMRPTHIPCHPHHMFPNTVDHPHWWCVHGIDMKGSSDLVKVTPYHVRYEVSGKLHDQPETISHKIYHFLGYKEFKAVWNCYGGNNATVEVTAPMKMKFVLAYRPDEKGNNDIQTVVYHPKRSFLSNITGLTLIKNILNGLLLGVLFYDDLPIIRHLEFQRNFTEEDRLFGKWIAFVKSLPYNKL